jgi:competence ComEA-like helix-hairpin-helix protein
MPRSEVAALGAIVAALAIVALAAQGLPRREPGAAVDDARAPRGHTGSRPAPAPDALAALRDGRAIDLNCADGATLELLPGVGPALAQRIVEHRKQIGRFDSVDALDAVRGVGPKTLEAVRPLLAASASACPASTTPTR